MDEYIVFGQRISEEFWVVGSGMAYAIHFKNEE
jgi:hypothetical protein